ncbi:cell division protein FtsQ/DivIB [Paramagnetospirillum magneticum]|uniref:Cell division protein FtsQ n=1 Tax=Paramagnetospirillum magneticum (strain ATCC 700264 / AMB-1) TaxID=342108 RepID=Q2W0G9_PARM1|nr:FtsQ-type POTRA domain-containing protein [Paramagnetospirillum magneticum]BAE52656.1 Cell division septal protein [Paramagnetospirillum magneticum AMB-1]
MRLNPSDIVITADDRPGIHRAPRQISAKRQTVEAPAARPKAKRRWPRLRLDMSPLQRLTGYGLAATILLIGGLALWHSGKPQRLVRETATAFLNSTAEAGFQVADITVSGRRRTPTDQLVSALGAQYGDPILGLDIAAARARIEALPSVRAAAIERRLPGAIHLSIVERQPVALWQTDSRFVLVDRDGHNIPGAIEGFEDLPLVVGDGAPARTDELFALLATEPELASRVKAAIRVSNRRWNIKLDDVEKGLEARLPELDTQVAWHRLAELEKTRALSGKQITMIDLRVPDRLVLKSEREPVVNTASAAPPARER